MIPPRHDDAPASHRLRPGNRSCRRPCARTANERPPKLAPAGLPAKLNASSGPSSVSFDTERGTLSVLDRRTGQTWSQKPAGPALLVKTASAKERTIEADSREPAHGPRIQGEIHPRCRSARDRVELTGSGELGQSLAFPYPFDSAKGSYLVMPVNEGMSYPVDDPSLPPMHYILYGGHGLCMAWWGVTDGRRGMMAIVETPDDASVRVPRLDGRLCLCPALGAAERDSSARPGESATSSSTTAATSPWPSATASHAQEAGLLKTLAEKQAENPNVDRLVGAVNVWCWDRDAVGIVKELQAAGIDRILWTQRRIRRADQGARTPWACSPAATTSTRT